MTTVWILFVLMSKSGTNGSPSTMATFQQEFKTLSECQKGSVLLEQKFASIESGRDLSSYCMEIRK